MSWLPVGELLSWELFSCNSPRDSIHYTVHCTQSISMAEVSHHSNSKLRFHVGRRFLRWAQQGSTTYTYLLRKKFIDLRRAGTTKSNCHTICKRKERKDALEWRYLVLFEDRHKAVGQEYFFKFNSKNR